MAPDLIKRSGAKYVENKYGHHTGRCITLTDMRVDRIDSSKTDMFFDRTSEDRAKNEPIKAYCARPHRHLVITYDGKVPVCCAIDPTDLSDELIVGDVNTQTLYEIWNSEKMHEYRKYLQDKDRSLPGCDTCNHKMSGFPHVVRLVE